MQKTSMVKYSSENIRTAIGPIDKIQGRPSFRSLWHLRAQLIAGTTRIKNDDHPTNGHSGYIMSRQEYALLCTKEWTNTPDVGSFFEIPANSCTDTEQIIGEKIWQVTKDRRDTLENVELTLVAILKGAIDTVYHTGVTLMGSTVIVPLTAPQIISRMKLNYGKPGIGKIKKELLRLNEPMDRDMLIEFMMRSLEEVQMFLPSSPEENRELMEVNLTYHALIKLSERGGFYTKAMVKWNGRLVADQRNWATFCTVMVGKYERMLAEGSVTTIHQEGYGTAFLAKEDMSDEESLTETIMKYAGRASQA